MVVLYMYIDGKEILCLLTITIDAIVLENFKISFKQQKQYGRGENVFELKEATCLKYAKLKVFEDSCIV